MVIIMKDLVCNYKLGPKFKEVVKPLMGRLFENVYIYITNNCNMYCAHCYLGNRLIERQEMPISNVIAHLKFWKELGASKVCFLGGEPTLYPFLKEAVDYAHRIGYKKVIRHQKEEANKNNALCIGVQALLRDRIIQSYNEYSEKGYCPIYAKDNIKRLYQPYSELGVDDVITELVSKLLQMPTERR